MQNHYLKGKHISEAQSSLLDSGTGKWLIHSRTKALQVMIRKIENGHDTYIWHDSSLPVLENQNAADPTNTTHWVVSDIVSNGCWTFWDDELRPIWQYIVQHAVPDNHAQNPDTWGTGPKPSQVNFLSLQPGT